MSFDVGLHVALDVPGVEQRSIDQVAGGPDEPMSCAENEP